MKFGSKCWCLPTLPTILDTSTVLLPRYIAPLAGTPRRISSGESRVLLVLRLSKSSFSRLSRARIRAMVKSRSTWSSRFIRSTTVITFLTLHGFNAYGSMLSPRGLGRIPQMSDLFTLGNLIGTKRDGKSPLGNLLEGVDLDGTHLNTISGNVIAFNGDNGVRVKEDPTSADHDANSNRILSNS